MAAPDPTRTRYQLLTCPYNKAHKVEQYRMRLHLQRCRTQYPPRSKKVPCPVDATHLVFEFELDSNYHFERCPKYLKMLKAREQVGSMFLFTEEIE